MSKDVYQDERIVGNQVSVVRTKDSLVPNFLYVLTT